jgi:hypothetical protein
MDMSSSASVKVSTAKGVAPADCGCGGAGSAPVCVLGALGFDFGTYARRDAFQAVNNGVPLALNSDLSSYLLVTPVDAESVIWTLSLNNTPVYALRPTGPYARDTYRQLQAYLVNPNIDLLSVPGRIAESATLLNGQVVPVVQPELTGIKPWSGASVVAPTAYLSGGVEALPVPLPSPVIPPQVYLTGEGSVDWVLWGYADALDVSRKLSATLPGIDIGGQIGMTVSGPAATRKIRFSNSFSWNDGIAPLPNVVPSTAFDPGFLSIDNLSAFSITAPADTLPRVLRLYVRAGQGSSTLTASISGNPVPAYVDSSLSSLGPLPFVDGVYTIAYRAALPGQMLTVTWAPGGPVPTYSGLQAATLQIGTLSRSAALQSYLDRLYFEMRNMGASPLERALNHATAYALTQPLPRLGMSTIFGAMFGRGMMLEDISGQRNEKCRPRADCWDVTLRFFNPSSNTEWSRTIFRITVDVSLVKPLVIGQAQIWNES